MLRIIILAGAIALGGCATIDGKQVFLPTVSIPNPVGVDDIASVKAAYGIAASVGAEYVDRYRAGRRCTVTRPESLTNLCSRRSIVERIRAADRRATAAIAAAETFIREHPNLDAGAAIAAARAAVNVLSSIRTGA